MTDLCFLCERNPVTWPGSGMCEACEQETADEAHRAMWVDDDISRLMREQDVSFVEAVEWLAAERGVRKP